MQKSSAEQREQAHAKLLSYQGRQVLAFVQRDAHDALCIILQLWCAQTDEQLRVSVAGQTERETESIFADLRDEGLEAMLDHLEVSAILGGLHA